MPFLFKLCDLYYTVAGDPLAQKSISAETHRNHLVLAAVVAVIVVAAVYFLVTYYASIRTAALESQIGGLQANNTALAQSNRALGNKYAVLQVSFNNTYTEYITLKGELANPSPKVLYQSKSIVLQSLLYPSFVNEGYNVSYLSFFEPTQEYIYYNSFKYPNYSPITVNASYSYFSFNLTEPESGYLTINYTSNSPSGLRAMATNCAPGASSLYSSQYSVDNANLNGSVQLPINKGANCVYIENPSQGGIAVRFTATFYGYIGS